MNTWTHSTDRPGPRRFLLKLLTLLSVLATAGPVAAREGDVTINATKVDEVACLDCPGGKGVQLCYEVSLAANAENEGAKDFHVQVNSAAAANFKCFGAEELVGGAWQPRTWPGSHASQVEDKANRHYASWYARSNGETIDQGETWRFCVVFCGSTNNLDNTIEFIVTDDGSDKPAVPQRGNNRGDVPNSGNQDDPGWAGTKTNAPGSGTGFLINVHVIEPGLDLFMTPGHSASRFDFRSTPIPANFFGPGSEPFTNVVVFQGEPLPPLGGGTLFPADTVVRRLDRALVPFGGQDTVPIEIVALNLVSCEPITVTVGGRNELWNVRIVPSPQARQPMGQMTLQASSHGAGGTFSATLPVQPRFVFLRQSDGQTRSLDAGLTPGFPSWTLHLRDVPWTDSPPHNLPLASAPAGLQFPPPFGARPSLVPMPGSSDNFVAGVRADLCDGQSGFLTRPVLSVAQAASGSLGLLPALSLLPDSDGDRIPDVADSCPGTPNPLQEDRDNDGVGDVCDNCPFAYNPCQENTDGQPGGDACGFVVDLPAGLSVIANNYIPTATSLDEQLPRVEDGTMLFRWLPMTRTYDVNIYMLDLGWQTPAPSLAPGEGVFVHSPVGQRITFGGLVQSPPPAPRPPPGFYLAGSRTPQPGTFEVLMGYPPIMGDRVHQFVEPIPGAVPPPPGAGAQTFEFGGSGWRPTEPVIQPGEAVFIELASASNANQPPVLVPLPDQEVHAGSVLRFRVAAVDPEEPATGLNYSLESAPPGASLDPRTGELQLATDGLAPGTVQRIGVRVADNGAPSLSAVGHFDLRTFLPPIQSAVVSDQALRLTWSALPGTRYSILSSTDPASGLWTPLETDLLTVENDASWTIQFDAAAGRAFYRIHAEPIPSLPAFVAGSGVTNIPRWSCCESRIRFPKEAFKAGKTGRTGRFNGNTQQFVEVDLSLPILYECGTDATRKCAADLGVEVCGTPRQWDPARSEYVIPPSSQTVSTSIQPNPPDCDGARHQTTVTVHWRGEYPGTAPIRGELVLKLKVPAVKGTIDHTLRVEVSAAGSSAVVGSPGLKPTR